MKIGIVTTWFERGAAYVSKQYEDLLKEKHEVFIYARGGEEYAISNPEWDRENVHWGKKYAMPNTSTYIDEKDFRNWIKKNGIDTVLFNEQGWWQSILICREMGVKTGAYIDYYTDRTLELFHAYDFLICNTKRHHSVFSWHEQCYYVPWGTDTDLFSPKDQDEKDIQDKNGLVFFHSAGMSPFRKGTDFVLESFAKLTDKYPECTLVIHTQASLVKSFPKLSSMIHDLIQKNRLKVIEKTVGAPGLYYKGDIYVYPSRLEGIGLTIAEAQSCGLPTITVDNGPMNEFIEEPSRVAAVKKFYCRGDGYYWPMCEVSTDDLAVQMEYFLLNKDKVENFKNTTRQVAVQKFNWANKKVDVNRIFETSKVLSANENIIYRINKYDNSKFPLITKYPQLYSRAYRLFKQLKKVFK